MSGRRRRDDGWDEGRRDPQPARRDQWSGGGAEHGGAGDWAAGNGYAQPVQDGNGYSAPSFQPFDAAGGAAGAPGAGYPGDGYDGRGDPGYGTGGYDEYAAPSAGAANGYGNGNGSNGYRNGANGYGGDANGYGSGANGYGGAGYGAADRGAAPQFTPGFFPADADGADDDGPAGTPRPVGRLSIFTLLDDKAAEFDRLAERAAEGVRRTEPDTLVYVIHVVPKAPMQRIIYEIYRDRAAFEKHERLPHIQRFAADRASCVLATNIIDLRLKYAKVAALANASADSAAADTRTAGGREREQAAERHGTETGSAGGYGDSWAPAAATGQYGTTGQYQAAAGAGNPPSDDRYQAAGQYAGSSATQYGAGQYADGQYAGGQYGSAADAGYSANGGYAGYPATAGYPGGDASQYPAASGGYAGQAAGYAANGTGQYPGAANGYQGTANGYQDGANGGYGGQPGTGYAGAAGVGYPAGAGQADASGGYAAAATGTYAAAANGAGYAAANGASYAGANAGYAGANGAGYGAANGGYPGANGAGYAGANGGYAGASGGYAAANGAGGTGANGGYAPANGAGGTGANGGYGGTAGGAYQAAGYPAGFGTNVGKYRELSAGSSAAGQPAAEQPAAAQPAAQPSDWDEAAHQGQRYGGE